MIWDDFLTRALIAGIGVALITGPLGCFVLWKRMSYFGDSLAHSTLLGIAFGLLLHVPLHLSVILVCALFAVLLTWLQQKRILPADTLLGVLAHSALALGIITISLSDVRSFDLHRYLFGSILTVQREELYWIYGGGVVITVLLINQWKKLVLTTLHRDIAKSEGIKIYCYGCFGYLYVNACRGVCCSSDWHFADNIDADFTCCLCSSGCQNTAYDGLSFYPYRLYWRGDWLSRVDFP